MRRHGIQLGVACRTCAAVFVGVAMALSVGGCARLGGSPGSDFFFQLGEISGIAQAVAPRWERLGNQRTRGEPLDADEVYLVARAMIATQQAALRLAADAGLKRSEPSEEALARIRDARIAYEEMLKYTPTRPASVNPQVDAPAEAPADGPKPR